MSTAAEEVDDQLARLNVAHARRMELERIAALHARLVPAIQAMRAEELAVDNDCARSAAAAYARVLRVMGAWDPPAAGRRVRITETDDPALIGREGEAVSALNNGIAVRVPVDEDGAVIAHRVVAARGWEEL